MGLLQYVHKTCLDEWRLRHHADHSNRIRCQECLAPFNYEVDDSILSDFGSEEIEDFKENFEIASWVFIVINVIAMVLIILATWSDTVIHKNKYNQLFFTSFIVTTGNIILIPITAKSFEFILIPICPRSYISDGITMYVGG